MPNYLLVLGATALALGGVISAAPACAADLDPPYLGSQAYPEDKVEFGSGWYIRGDLGATRLPSIGLTTPPIPTATGAVPQPPTAIITRGNTAGFDASIGGGYKVNRWFRADVVADFHQPVATSFSAGNGSIFCPTAVNYPLDVQGNPINMPTYASGGCTGNYVGKLSSYDVLLNGYLDLGTWYGVTPFIGAGVGLSFGHYQTSSSFVQANGAPYQVTYSDAFYKTSFYQNYDRRASGTYYNFAWALMAGAAYDIYDHTKLELGYRYLNLGKVDGISNTLYSHEVRAGVRYMIDD